jgi:hypothetical protein
MEFTVHSKQAFAAALPPDVPHVIVSINCPGDDPPRFQANEQTLGRVNLFFWDLDAIPYGQDSVRANWELCEPGDARQVVELLDTHPDAQHVVVHCTAGKSRSAAVAAALMKSIEGDDSPIFNDPRYRPNMRVYRMVLEAWHDKRSGG